MRSTEQDGSATRTCGEQTCRQIPARTPHNRVLRMKSEGELVEVVVKVLPLDPAVVGSQPPAFQERGDQMNVRQEFVSKAAGSRDVGYPVVIALPCQRLVATPSVRKNDRAGSDCFLDKRDQAHRGNKKRDRGAVA
jgi:hypothetical protein